jgi:hypothetical protein
MGKPRVRGSHAKISVQLGDRSYDIGEVSKFSVKELGEVKKSRSMGEQEVTANKTFEGYDLSFEGGKVDFNASVLLHNQDQKIKDGEAAPYFTVTQKITYYGNKVEEYVYRNVVLYGYNLDMDANDEMTEKFEGFSGSMRTLTPPGEGSTDIKALNDAVKAAMDAVLAQQKELRDTPRATLP